MNFSSPQISLYPTGNDLVHHANCLEETALPISVHKQCSHLRPPAVSFTKSGAVLSLVWNEEPLKDMLFTVDLVPNLPTVLGKGVDQVSVSFFSFFAFLPW